MRVSAYSILLILLLFPESDLRAEDLYSGSAPVSDQSPAQRQSAMPESLKQVLQKISGLTVFDEYPQVQPALATAGSMAISFSYRTRERLLPDGTVENELLLVTNFAPRAVDDLVKELQLPLWKSERRPVTLWFLVDDGVGRRIMPIEFQQEFDSMAQVAADRGLPVRVPIADEEGGFAVDPQLLWGGFTEELQESGPVDALVVAAGRDGPEWNVRMTLDYGSVDWSSRQRGIRLVDVLVQAMNEAINEVAASQSIAAADLGQSIYSLTVSGVLTSADYVRCLNYLQSLSLVNEVAVVSARPGQVQFNLALAATPQYLLSSFESDGVLFPTAVEGEFSMIP